MSQLVYTPKFNYQEMFAEFIDAIRRYTTPIGRLPSITSVLGKTCPPEKMEALYRWQKSLGPERAKEASEKATVHGSNVHLLCERHFRGEDILAPIDDQPVNEDDLGSFRSLKHKLKLIDEVWGIEVPLFSTDLLVAGRVDIVGTYKGIPSIIDFKTAGRLKTREDITDYALQLTFYAVCHNEMFGTNIEQGVILMTTGTGFPLEFIYDLSEHVDELMDRVEEFYATHELTP